MATLTTQQKLDMRRAAARMAREAGISTGNATRSEVDASFQELEDAFDSFAPNTSTKIKVILSQAVTAPAGSAYTISQKAILLRAYVEVAY